MSDDFSTPQPGDDCTPQPTADAIQAAVDANDDKAPDKLALRASQAGMRFIAQMTIYNSGDDTRLAQFIDQAYHPQLLDAQSVAGRVQVFKTTRNRLGRLKVKQVIATGEHQAIVVMETEHTNDYFMMQIQVEEDYPHRITAYMHQPLQPVQSDTATDNGDT